LVDEKKFKSETGLGGIPINSKLSDYLGGIAFNESSGGT
jgi:hypothetical protein